jgi:hypothetical protein
MINGLRDLLQTTGDLAYLAPIVEAARRKNGLTVATLNYDTSLEQAAEAAGMAAYTGIESWIKHRHWEWPDYGLRLLKLHGSIDWCWQTSPPERGHLPLRKVEPTTLPFSDQRAPALVFGQRGKLREDGPFLALLTEFERLLEDGDRLIVVGYSFRDGHVNEVIRRWTAADISRTIVIVDPDFPNNMPRLDGFRYELVRHLNPPAFPNQPPPVERVSVIRQTAAAALAELFV